ncbi:MAG: peptidoglycan-binding domain-containing protein [Acidimicrobiia bacterium]|nr:peptidoglycan-binding domain-containing protein [Acidimicrobiia bacterium]
MLRNGSSGDEVRQLQDDLALLGFDPGPIDGAFGPKTEAAVRAFQESVDSLGADGIVGPKTAASLASRVGPKRAAQRLAGGGDDAGDETASSGGSSTPL